MRRLPAGQGELDSSPNTSSRDATSEKEHLYTTPREAFDTALGRPRARSGHALRDALPVPSPPPPWVQLPLASTLPWGEQRPGSFAEPESGRMSDLGVPAAMVPDVAIRLGRLGNWLSMALAAWERHRRIEALRQLDDHLLKDMGLRREDLRGGERSREALRRLKAEREG